MIFVLSIIKNNYDIFLNNEPLMVKITLSLVLIIFLLVLNSFLGGKVILDKYKLIFPGSNFDGKEIYFLDLKQIRLLKNRKGVYLVCFIDNKDKILKSQALFWFGFINERHKFLEEIYVRVPYVEIDPRFFSFYKGTNKRILKEIEQNIELIKQYKIRVMIKILILILLITYILF